VKREADAKAPRDHSHQELERIDRLLDRMKELSTRLDDVEGDLAALEGRVTDHDDTVAGVTESIDQIQERLRTVAWAVTDLRESHESGDSGTVEAIRRAAAEADVDRAACERCGNGVDIALLTDPECPHCQATVTDVRPAAGFFSKPRLQVASQLESGGE
jgi:predicted nucleic acid-binding Zn ribbon protein